MSLGASFQLIRELHCSKYWWLLKNGQKFFKAAFSSFRQKLWFFDFLCCGCRQEFDDSTGNDGFHPKCSRSFSSFLISSWNPEKNARCRWVSIRAGTSPFLSLSWAQASKVEPELWTISDQALFRLCFKLENGLKLEDGLLQKSSRACRLCLDSEV